MSVFLGEVWWPVWDMTRFALRVGMSVQHEFFFIFINSSIFHFFILSVFIQEAWSWPSSLWLPSDHICCGAVVWWTNIWKIWRYFWKQSCPGFVFYGSSHELHDSWFGINCKHAVSVKTPFHCMQCKVSTAELSGCLLWHRDWRSFPSTVHNFVTNIWWVKSLIQIWKMSSCFFYTTF